jgi:4-amino-4-deoxy-L-arabinose transferase-like glycosyltransferase
MLYNDRQALMRYIARKLTPKKEWFYTLALTILAAIPRLCCLDLVEFKRDEANHYRMAYFLTRGHWHWVGSSASIGFPKPPLFVYTLSLPLMVSNDPRVVTGFLGLLAALASGVFYLVLRRFLGRRAAFAATLLFALNPQAVMYGRKLFTADLLPPLCCLFLASGVAFLVSPRRHAGWMAILAAFTFALVILTTFSPLMLLPALVVLVLERRRDLRPVYWTGAGAALILPFVPYLIAVMPHISTIASVATASESSDSARPILAWIWTLLQGISWPENLFSVDGLVALALAALSLIGLLFLINQARERRGHWARFFLVWLLLSPLVALAMPFKIHPHYFVALYPLIFALPVAGGELLARKSNVAGWIALALVIAIAIWNVYGLSDILQAAASGASWFGTPAGYWWRAAEQARTLAAERSANEVLLILPDDQDGRLDALLSDTPHRVVDGQTTVVYPHHSAVMVIGPQIEPTHALTAPCTQDLASDLVASPFGGTYRYRLWDPAHADAAACAETLLPVDARWASGVRLLGYGVSGTSKPGETLHVFIHWETTQGPLKADVHWFNHLEDQEGRRWGQLDLVGWPAERWQAGDRILMHFDLPIAADAAPGPYVLRVGQYIYHSPEDLENIPVIDKAGNPADYAVVLPVPE